MSTFLILIPLLIQLLILKKSEALTCYKCSHNDFKKISSRSIYDRIEISLKSCRKVEFCNGTWCVQRVDGNEMSLGCVNQSALSSANSFGEDILLSLDANNQLIDSDSPSVDSHCRAYFASNDGLMHGVCYCRTRDFCNHAPQKKIPPAFLMTCIVLLPFLFIFS